MRPAGTATWIRLHRLPQFAASLAAMTLAAHLGANAYVPGVAGGPQLPAWQLIPCGFGLVAGLAVGDETPRWFAADPVRVRVGRLAAVAGVTVATALVAHVSTTLAGLPSLAATTACLAAATFGLATLVGRWASFVNLALGAYIVLRSREYAVIPTDGGWIAHPGITGPLALLGACAYVGVGPRSL